jgi:hypothetical protein
MQKRLIGLIVLGVGVFLGWQRGQAVVFLMDRGQPLGELLSDPAILMSVTATVLAVVGGLAGLLALVPAWVAMLGAAVPLALIGGVQASMGLPPGGWADEVGIAVGLALCAVAYVAVSPHRGRVWRARA